MGILSYFHATSLLDSRISMIPEFPFCNSFHPNNHSHTLNLGPIHLRSPCHLYVSLHFKWLLLQIRPSTPWLMAF